MEAIVKKAKPKKTIKVRAEVIKDLNPKAPVKGGAIRDDDFSF